jgi:hypothetical protein
MTDAQIIKLLQAIKSLALLEYPYPADAPTQNDPSLLIGLGEIAGVASRAIDTHTRRSATPTRKE